MKDGSLQIIVREVKKKNDKYPSEKSKSQSENIQDTFLMIPKRNVRSSKLYAKSTRTSFSMSGSPNWVPSLTASHKKGGSVAIESGCMIAFDGATSVVKGAVWTATVLVSFGGTA